MAKKAPKEFGHLTGAVESMDFPKPEKPKLTIQARMDGDMVGGSDKKYHKERLAHMMKEIKAIEAQLKDWDHEKIGKQAHKSLSQELAIKKSRLLEHKIMAGDDDGDEA